MINEAHNGLRRSVRTRRVGRQVLRAAHEMGVRHLAMEALYPEFVAEANETRSVPVAEGGYLAQPEMREFIAAALELGWTLVAYEADFSFRPLELEQLSIEATNWREEQQARNLAAAVAQLPNGQPLLVWCGNSHLSKREAGAWQPMGLRFWQVSGVEPFSIDQTSSIDFGDRTPYAARWVQAYADEIAARGGAAGFLGEEAPDGWSWPGGEDAFILASDNGLS